MKSIQRNGSVLLVLMCLSFSGCEDYSTPESTLKSAGQALFENNPILFNQALTDNALVEYGNLEGMQRLQGLIGRTSPEIRSMTRIDSREPTYLSELRVDGRDVLEVTIRCELKQTGPETSLLTAYEREPHPSPANLVRRQTCKISGLKLL